MSKSSVVGQENGNGGEQSADTGKPDQPNANFNKPEEPKTNLIINYLPQHITPTELLALFANFGKVDTFKQVRDKATNQSLGYAFVNYDRPEDAEKAIKTLNGLRLQNKTIKVSYARPRSAGIVRANLYVTGFPIEWSLEDFEALFRPYGSIISSRILYDKVCVKMYVTGGTDNPMQGLSLRVGFVRLGTRMEAESAVRELNGTIPSRCSTPITVTFASVPGNVNHPAVAPSIHLASQATCHFGSPFNNSAKCLKYSPLGEEPPLNLMVPINARNSLGWRIFIYNLSAEAHESELWQLFCPFGAVHNVKIIRDTVTNICKGYGFVTMAYYEDAVVAINMLDGYRLFGRVLQVNFKTNNNNKNKYSALN